MTGIPVIIKVIKDTRKRATWQLKSVFTVSFGGKSCAADYFVIK
jgi:hypothetical protein